MSTQTIDIQVRDKVSANIARKITEIGEAASSSHNAVEELKAALESFSAIGEMSRASRDAAELRSEIQGATQAVAALSDSATGAAAGIDAAGGSAQRLSTDLDNADRSARTINNTGRDLANTFNRAALAIGGVLGVRELARLADQGTTLKDQLDFVTDSTVSTSDAFHQLGDIARNTGLRFADVGNQFTANARIMAEMGKTTEQQMKFQEGLSGAIATSGLRGEAAAVVMNALSRSMARGTLRGEEFNTVMERGQDVVRLIAEEMGTTTGELRALAEAGAITGERLFEAFVGPLDQINERVAGMSWSISGAMNALQTELVRFISDTNDATGAAEFFANAILFVADNIDIVVTAAGVFMAAWGVAGVIGVVTNVIAALGMLTKALAVMGAALLANPITALVTALTVAAVAALYLTGNLDGFLGVVGSVFQSVTGMNNATDDTSKSMNAAGEATAGALSNLSTYGADGTRALADVSDAANTVGTAVFAASEASTTALAETTEAADGLASAVGGIGEQAPAIDSASSAVVAFRGEIEETSSKVNGLIGFLRAAWDLARKLATARLSDVASSSSSGGGDNAPGFQHGGSFMVGGSGGVDKNLVSFRASRGERVDILTPDQQRRAGRNSGGYYHGGNTVSLTVVTPNADSFRRSGQQIYGQLNSILAAT